LTFVKLDHQGIDKYGNNYVPGWRVKNIHNSRTVPEKESSQKRPPKVWFKRQQMRSDAREHATETCPIRGKVGKRSAADNPVRMVTEQVILLRRKFRRLYETHRKVGAEKLPDARTTHRLPASSRAAAARGLPYGVVVDDPREVAKCQEEKRREKNNEEKYAGEHRSYGEADGVEEDRESL